MTIETEWRVFVAGLYVLAAFVALLLAPLFVGAKL